MEDEIKPEEPKPEEPKKQENEIKPEEPKPEEPKKQENEIKPEEPKKPEPKIEFEELKDLVEEKKDLVKVKKSTLWQAATGVLFILLIVAILTGGFGGIADITGGAKDIPEAPTGDVTPPTEPTKPSIDDVPRVDVSEDDDPVKGSADAPITIIEFSDFQCPFCSKFYREAYPQIIENYIDTGKVRLIFRDFPLTMHDNAQKAAEAAECADEQDKFWEMHDMLFENQDALTADDLKGYAEELGLDTEAFDSCLDNGDMEAEVQADLDDGMAAGVRGTPTFYINGIMLIGAQPFEIFQEVIDLELARLEEK